MLHEASYHYVTCWGGGTVCTIKFVQNVGGGGGMMWTIVGGEGGGSIFTSEFVRGGGINCTSGRAESPDQGAVIVPN